MNRLLLISLLFLPLTTHCQTYRDVVAKMRDDFQHSESVHIEMNVTVFESKVSKTPVFSQVAIVKRDGMKYSCKFGDNEMLMNDRYILVVSHQSREIVISKRGSVSFQEDEFNFSKSLDSLFNLYGDPKLVSKQGVVHHYRLIKESGPIKSLDIFINSSSNQIQKFEYQYREGQKVNIDFSIFKSNPAFTPATFGEQKFITEVDGRWKGVGKFQNFAVVKVD